MKKIAILFLAGLSFANAKAQIEFGAKAGMNFSTQSGYDAGDARTLFNFNAGVFLKLPAARGLSIQPEVYYSGQGASYDTRPGTERYHADYVNIPVLLKFAHRAGYYVETGPQLGILTGASHVAAGVSVPNKDEYNNTDFAWVFGIGFKIPESPVGIDFRYNVGLANVENRAVTGYTGSIRNDVLQLGITYVLASSRESRGSRGGRGRR